MTKYKIIGMPMKYGCPVNGADLAFEKTKDLYKAIFKDAVFNEIDKTVTSYKEDKKIKYLKPVMEISNRLYSCTLDAFNNNYFPIIVGGDHSSAIGSVSSALDYTNGDLSVIWIDAHADIHNEKTTPSGNIHGMPLSICIGRCDKRFDIGNYKLDPKNLFYIGLRSFEMEEIDYIHESGATCYMDFEVIERKIENIVKEIIKHVKTKYVHISFDLDVLSEKEFEAVNVMIDKKYIDGAGLSLVSTIKALNMLITNLNVISMDIVEYNPILDTDLSCKKKIKNILEVIYSSMSDKNE